MAKWLTKEIAVQPPPIKLSTLTVPEILNLLNKSFKNEGLTSADYLVPLTPYTPPANLYPNALPSPELLLLDLPTTSATIDSPTKENLMELLLCAATATSDANCIKLSQPLLKKKKLKNKQKSRLSRQKRKKWAKIII